MTEQEAKEWLANDTSSMKIHAAELQGENPMEYINSAIEVAIKALEKQIAKKPIIKETDEKKLYKCPCCDKVFVEAYDTVQRGFIPSYCNMCGQAIENMSVR